MSAYTDIHEHTFCAVCNHPDYDWAVDGHEPTPETPMLALNRAMLNELLARAHAEGFTRGLDTARREAEREAGQ